MNERLRPTDRGHSNTKVVISIYWHNGETRLLRLVVPRALTFFSMHRCNCSIYYYRPPIQDGPAASSHNTEVLSVPETVLGWDARMRFVSRREMARLGERRVVVVEVLNGPINGGDDLREC